MIERHAQLLLLGSASPVLMGVADTTALWQHPRSGASWEGFALEQVLHTAQPDEAYF